MFDWLVLLVEVKKFSCIVRLNVVRTQNWNLILFKTYVSYQILYSVRVIFNR